MSAYLTVNERQNLRPKQVSENKENIQLIWLDGNITNSSDYILTKSMLIELNPAVQFYSDFDKCIDLIKTIKDEQIFLIVSGSLVRNLLSKVNHYRPLVAIFIFCANRQYHESLLNEYEKIIGIYTNKKTLLEVIRKKIFVFEKQTLAFNLFDQKQKSMKDLSKQSASFLWHQMLIYILKQIPKDQQSKQQMIELCQDYYQNDKIQLKKIESFRINYQNNQAIQWYTDEGFLYKLLNKALRTEDIQLLYTFRFFIIDLCTAIENQRKYFPNKNPLTLYRGTRIPKEELQKLKENIGQIISTNGFFSTSRNENVSINFARSNDFEGVLFEIHADPWLKSISFADIENKSLIKNEEEVLFNLNSTFRIYSVNFDQKYKLWKIQLNATDEGSEKVQEYLILAKRQMKEYSPMITFGRLIWNGLGQLDQAKKYFETLLKSLPSDHPDIGSVYNNIGEVYRYKDDMNLALKNYEIGYDICRKRLSPDHPHIADLLHNIGLIHQRKRNYKLALDYYQKALKIEEKNDSNDHVKKAIMILNIGLVHSDKNDFDIALNYLFRALQMFKRVLPNRHSTIASCLGNIAYVYENKNDFNVALDYYQQKLIMEEQCLPFDHPNIFFTFHSIANIHTKMGHIEQGLEFCREKLHDQKNQLGKSHPCLARTLMIMGDIITDNNRDDALQYYKEALSILKHCIPSDHQTTSKCLTAMMCLYYNSGNYKNALQYQLKALDYDRQILSSDHVFIANNLRNVGLCYEVMNHPSKALQYYNESLSIYRANYNSEHEDVKKVKKDIARLKNQK
jgi:tetratricopeptide (TPR) repeat protein